MSIISNEKAEARLNNPMNLINQMNGNSARKSSMSLFGIGLSASSASSTTPKVVEVKEVKETAEEVKVTFNPFEKRELTVIPPNSQELSIDNILEDSEAKIKLAHAHDQALDLLTNSVKILATKLDDVKADRLPGVITAAGKVVESIRRERLEINKSDKNREVHYHFYTPTQKTVSDYGEVIEIS